MLAPASELGTSRMAVGHRTGVGRGAAVVALALLATLTGACGRSTSGVALARCGPSSVRATFSLVPGSQGAGQVEYTLTITNTGRASCTISGLPAIRLLGAGHVALATRAHADGGGSHAVKLAAGRWAQSNATFSPDIAASNEPGDRCEPLAYSLALTLRGGGRLLAPMDPTMVCQHGAIAFTRLRVVPRTSPCRSSSLAGSFRAVGAPYSGQATYALVLSNHGTAPCVVVGTPHVELESRGGDPVPTSPLDPVAYPYVIAPSQRATLDANAYTNPGPGEPTHGDCEAPASRVALTMPDGGGKLTLAIAPPRAFCRRGQLVLSGLFLNG
jgi:hypothetical protein